MPDLMSFEDQESYTYFMLSQASKVSGDAREAIMLRLGARLASWNGILIDFKQWPTAGARVEEIPTLDLDLTGE